jgi:hypothetical protein
MPTSDMDDAWNKQTLVMCNELLDDDSDFTSRTPGFSDHARSYSGITMSSFGSLRSDSDIWMSNSMDSFVDEDFHTSPRRSSKEDQTGGIYDEDPDLIPDHPYATRIPEGLSQDEAKRYLDKCLYELSACVEVGPEYFRMVADNQNQISKNLEFMMMKNGNIAMLTFCPYMKKFPSGLMREEEVRRFRHYKRDLLLSNNEFIGYFFCGRTYAFHNVGASVLTLHVPVTQLELLECKREYIFDLLRDITTAGPFLVLPQVGSTEIIQGSLYLGTKYEVFFKDNLLYVLPTSNPDARNLSFRLWDDLMQVVHDRNLPSIGSAGHCNGNCTPCQFECFANRKCLNGAKCTLCHCEHVSKKKQRSNEWNQIRKERYEQRVSQSASQRTSAPCQETSAPNHRQGMPSLAMLAGLSQKLDEILNCGDRQIMQTKTLELTEVLRTYTNENGNRLASNLASVMRSSS